MRPSYVVCQLVALALSATAWQQPRFGAPVRARHATPSRGVRAPTAPTARARAATAMMMSSYDARGSAPIVVREDYKLAAAFTAIGVASLAAPLFAVLPSLVCVTAGLGPLLSVEPGTGRSIEWQDYKGNLACALFGLLTLVPALGGAVWGGFCTVFGLFLAFQTYRVRFVFEDGAISVQNRKLPLLDGEDVAFGDDALVSSGENFAVGGENKWACSSVVNWEFFPRALVEFTGTPILVYFKETSTPRDKWDEGPGQFANSEAALAAGAVAGQVHFFPAIVNKEEIERLFVEQGCGKLEERYYS